MAMGHICSTVMAVKASVKQTEGACEQQPLRASWLVSWKLLSGQGGGAVSRMHMVAAQGCCASSCAVKTVGSQEGPS